MPALVAPERSEVAFVEDYVDSAAADYGADSGVVSVEDSKARVLAAISLKIYTQTTLALTNSRLVGYEWTVILALLPVLPLSMVAVAIAVDSTQNQANRSWFGMCVFHPESSFTVAD